jgi:hypothetical protein
MRQSWSPIVVAVALGGIAGGIAGGLAGVALIPNPVRQPVTATVGAPIPDAPAAAPAADPHAALVTNAEAAQPTSAVAPTKDALPAPDEAGAAWTRLDAELARLRLRVAELDRRLAAAQVKPPAADPAGQRRLGATSDGRRSALVEAGLPEEAAAELVRRQGQQALERLNLRDLAAREGWLATDRYRDELARLDDEAVQLRGELGDEVYDRYLYAAGEDNRVQVDSIIAGSAADLAGLQPGDLIESYAGERIFNFSELRDATASGEHGELVPVRVLRGGQVIDAWVARGPLGVELDAAQARPR